MKTFAEIIAYIVTAILIGLAFKLYYKKQFVLSGALAVLGFLCFIATFRNNLSDEQMLCWAAGFAFFLFSVYLVREDHLSYAFIVFLISACSCFCGLSGVQALLRTHLLWLVSDSLKHYGDKIDNYQTNLASMQESLASHQSEISSNNSAILTTEKSLNSQERSNQIQYKQLLTLAETLHDTTTNLDAQEQRLTNVEFWVENLYDNLTNEFLVSTDTNSIRCFNVPENYGRILCLVKLSHTPIRGSLEVFVKDPRNGIDQRAETAFVDGNLIAQHLMSFDTNNIKITARYVQDTRKTNLWPFFPILNQSFFIYSNGSVTFIHPQ